MIRRLRGIAVVAVMLCALAPTSAFAWFNGDTADGFGTHDWILYEALLRAGSSWVDTPTALAASDDPDSLYGIEDKVNHFYLLSGSYRGGPDTVNRLYRLTARAYAAGDRVLASRYLGVLSHYYADLCQPYHTRDGVADTLTHIQYESDVERRTDEPGENAAWITTWARTSKVNPRAMATEVALASRATYTDIQSQYVVGAGFNTTVEFVTRTLLTRAVNDLADITRSIPSGTRNSAPVRLTTKISNRYPSVNATITTTVQAVDLEGRPVEGVRIDFRWLGASTENTAVVYTNSDGFARSRILGGRLRMGERVNVTVAAPDSLRSKDSHLSTWFIPTDDLGYMRSSVSERYPSQKTRLVVTTLCLNQAGQPIRGLRVTNEWRFKTMTVRRTVITGADGIARDILNIGRAAKQRTVPITTSVPASGKVHTDSTWFKPRDNVATMTIEASATRPRQNTTVTVRARCLDENGAPVAGAQVSWLWRHRGAAYLFAGVTDAAGVASTSRNIGRSTKGYIVRVSATAGSGDTSRTVSTWFSPR